MKKFWKPPFQLNEKAKKLILTMKLTVFILFLTLMQVSATVYSQATKFSFRAENKQVVEVLRQIEENSDFRFFFLREQVDVERKVTVTAREATVEQILEELFRGQPVSYEFANEALIVLTRSDNPLGSVNSFLQGNMQQPAVSGTVTDESGQPLPGVTVIVKGTTQGTVTNNDGNYSITNIPENVTLVFSFVGMRTQEVVVGSQTNINITMEFDAIGIEEVIAVGYGTMKKSDLTGSVQRINTESYQYQNNTSVLEMLSGTVAGFNSTQGTRASGGGSMEIRGPNSLKASSQPLVVLDGAIYNGDIDNINPEDIENIDILKDASSAAVFGSKSASGVIIITTKRGATGEPSINFTSKIGISGLTNTKLRSFNGDEYMTAREYALSGSSPGKPPYYFSNPNNLPTEISVDEWLSYDSNPVNNPLEVYAGRLTLFDIEIKNYLAGNETDWYDLIFQNGLKQDYDISLSGGTDQIKYFWSAGYTNNQGIVVGDEYKTFRSRVNIDANVASFLNIGLNAHFSDQDNSSQMANLSDLWKQPPYGDMYNEDGTLTWYTHGDIGAPNPFILSEYLDKFDKIQSLYANLFGEIKLPFGFSIRSSFVNRYFWNNSFNFYPLETPVGFNNNGRGGRTNTQGYEWIVDNILKWNRKIAKIHNFDFTFLVNAQKFQRWNNSMTNSQFAPTVALSYHSIQSGVNPQISSTDQYKTENALMGRLNYSLLDKYLLTITYRRDGSSVFGTDNKFASFPSIGAGWWISEEKFYDAKWLNQLKIRASWGKNGNSDIGLYDALAKLTTVQYIYGNSLVSGVTASSMANNNLKWESTDAYNFGIDFGVMKNKIHGTADLYLMTTTDLLLNRSLPSIIGYPNVSANLGELENKGFELTLNSSNINRGKQFRWNSSLVFSFNRNKINKLYGEMIDVYDESGNVVGQKEADDWTNNWFIGQSIDRIWDYDVIGVWQIGEENEAEKYGKVPGDHKLRDVNEDGDFLPADDKVFQGYLKPQYRLGLRNDFNFLENFTLSIFIRADLGYYGSNNLLYFEDTPHFIRANIYNRPYWTPENPSNTHARLWSNFATPNYNYYENKSFVRIQDINFSYNIPKDVTEKLKVKNLKTFISLRNILTFTKWSQWDPESGNSPMPKTYTLGLNVNF